MKRIYRVNDKEWIEEDVREIHSTSGNLLAWLLSLGAILYTIHVLF